MIRWLFYIAAGLAAAAAAIYAWGIMLPRDHTASAVATIMAPPDAVFAVIEDIDAAASWRNTVASVERVDSVAGRERFLERGEDGDVLYEVIENSPPLRRVVRIADDSLPYGGSWTIEIVARDEGSEVTITEDGFVRDPLMRVFATLFFPPTRTMEAYLSDLEARFR